MCLQSDICTTKTKEDTYMNIILNVTERKPLAALLGEYKNTKPKYLRAPSYGYQIGDLLLTREGNIEGPDTMTKCWSQARLAIFRPVELTNFRTYKNSQCTFSFRFTYYLMVIIHQLLLLQFHICFHDSCFL